MRKMFAMIILIMMAIPAIVRATSNLANTLGSDLKRISDIYRGE